MKKNSSQLNPALRDTVIALRWMIAHKVASVFHLILSLLAIGFVFFPSLHHIAVCINGGGLGLFLMFNSYSFFWHKRRDHKQIADALKGLSANARK